MIRIVERYIFGSFLTYVRRYRDYGLGELIAEIRNLSDSPQKVKALRKIPPEKRRTFVRPGCRVHCSVFLAVEGHAIGVR